MGSVVHKQDPGVTVILFLVEFKLAAPAVGPGWEAEGWSHQENPMQ